MSAGERQIVCRRCGEIVRIDTGSCPHCGADIRGRKGPIAMLAVGLIIAGGAALDFGRLWPYGLIGLFVAVGGGYLLYDRRRRIRQAHEGTGGAQPE
jgi:hypothetical protein